MRAIRHLLLLVICGTINLIVVVKGQETKVSIKHLDSSGIKDISPDKNRTQIAPSKKSIKAYVQSGKISASIANTNTAFYSYKALVKAELDVPDLKNVQSFLTSFKPYIIDLLNTPPTNGQQGIRPQIAPNQQDNPNTDSIRNQLIRTNRIMMQYNTIKNKYISCIRASYANNTPKNLKDCLDIEDILTVDSALTCLQNTYQQLCLLQKNIANMSVSPDPEESSIADLAMKAIADYPNNIGRFEHLKKIRREFRKADSVKTIDLAEITDMQGAEIVLTIKPNFVLEFAGIEAPTTEYTMSFLPDWSVRFGLSGSLIHWIGDDFNKYSTVSVTNGFAIKPTPNTDIPNTSFAVGLSLTPYILDWRKYDGSGSAIWLPEIYFTPFDKTPSFGLGAAFSYNALKIGVGCLWIRNAELDRDITSSSILPSDKDLVLRNAYLPRFFISLSVMGFAPFTL